MADESEMYLAYELSGLAQGHSSDVRDVVALSDDLIASCSRDGTIRFWQRKEEKKLEEVKLVTGHQNVHKMGTRALAFVAPGSHPIFKDGALISGGSDKVILIWDATVWTADEKEPLMHFIGHEGNVTCLTNGPNGLILSGSADTTARVWQGNVTLHELKGHSAPVWSIVALSNGTIATASGDRTVKLWRDGKCTNTLTGHLDSVRSLCELPGFGFLSASNDATVKLWSYEGELLRSIESTDGFLYSVRLISPREFVTASESGIVRIYRDFESAQALEHGIGVWTTCVLPSGDIVCAGMDGLMRVWSRNPERKAEDELIAAHQQGILDKERSTRVGDLDLSKLPGPEALLTPGQREGDSLILAKEGKGYMYEWKAGQWEMVGEVMDAADNTGGTGKAMLNGRTYDYVWDVEIGDGGPLRQIGYNRGENPYIVAQKFIETENLDQNFLQQIANFIEQNAGVSATEKLSSQQNQSTPDRQSTSTSSEQHKSLGADSLRLPPSNSTYYPQKKPVVFEGGNVTAIVNKLKEFNVELRDEPSMNGLAMTGEELLHVDAAVKKIAATNFYHVSTFTDAEFAVLTRVATSWPLTKLFPVIDLLRLMVLHPHAAQRFIASSLVFDVISRTVGTEGSPVANTMLGYRLLSNCFMFDPVRPKLLDFEKEVLDNAARVFPEANKNTKLAVATALLNFSSLRLLSGKLNGDALLGLVVTLIQSTPDDDVLLILMVALGTLVYSSEGLRSRLKETNLKAVLQRLAEGQDGQVKQCSSHLAELL